MKKPNRAQLNAWLLPLATLIVLASLFLTSGEWYDFAIRGTALLFLLILMYINYIWNLLYHIVLHHKTSPKAPCPYYTAEQCPHGDKRECRYDTAVCHLSFSKPKKSRGVTLSIVFLISMSISVLAELVIEKEGFLSFIDHNYDIKTILTILQPLSNSLIAAVVVYFLIDIPGRLREYQDFFVDLLSSDKHLKLMEEKRLTKLRKDITWQLHVKDFPNMPKGLIDIDERFCEMLKKPYFKTYSQTTTVSSIAGNHDKLKKKVRVEYTAYNPHATDKTIRFDIGIANSLSFSDDPTEDEAKTLFRLMAFSICFEKDEKEYNLLPQLRIGVTKEKKDGFLYNGRIVLMPKGNHSNEREPWEKERMDKLGGSPQEELSYEMMDDSSQAGLYVTFRDKIRVKFEYEVVVPKDDISYTKRLRYPVKYFTLDYSFDASVNDMTVVGQIIGTLIDQPDISAEISDDKKRITLKTKNWLLPKNGAVVVHCKA